MIAYQGNIFVPHCLKKRTGLRFEPFRAACGKAIVFTILLCLAQRSVSQEQKLLYAIHHKGKKVGELSFRRQRSGARTLYNLQSEVNVRMLFAINVKTQEQAVYENELLQFSSVLRQVNGRQKTNRQIRNNGRGLTVSADGESHELKNYRVKYSALCLYSTEPVLYTNVFADNFQAFVPIVKMADHHYRITLPDGSSNDYFYEGGICQKVQVRSSLFDAEFILASF